VQLRVDDLVKRMVALLDAMALDSLGKEPHRTIQALYPKLRLCALAGTSFTSDECATDGYYQHADPLLGSAAIFYDEYVAPERIRFTLIHELGHHLIRSVDPTLLDAIDQLAGANGNPEIIEERACHTFASYVLIPPSKIADTADRPTGPERLIALHDHTTASWEACAVALSQHLPGAAAVIIVRQPGRIAFCASTPALAGMWPRDSAVDPTGPLSRCLNRPVQAKADYYAWRLWNERQLWCDAQPIHNGLAVAVLSTTPSDGGLNILQPEHSAPRDVDPCPRCEDGWLITGWCDACRSKRCADCGACKCQPYARVQPRMCSDCFLIKPPTEFPKDSQICADCLGD